MSIPVFVIRLGVAMNHKEIPTAEALAWRVGVSRGTAYSWMKGHSMPSADALVKLRRELGVSIDWLLGVSDTSEAA